MSVWFSDSLSSIERVSSEFYFDVFFCKLKYFSDVGSLVERKLRYFYRVRCVGLYGKLFRADKQCVGISVYRNYVGNLFIKYRDSFVFSGYRSAYSCLVCMYFVSDNFGSVARVCRAFDVFFEYYGVCKLLSAFALEFYGYGAVFCCRTHAEVAYSHACGHFSNLETVSCDIFDYFLSKHTYGISVVFICKVVVAGSSVCVETKHAFAVSVHSYSSVGLERHYYFYSVAVRNESVPCHTVIGGVTLCAVAEVTRVRVFFAIFEITVDTSVVDFEDVFVVYVGCGKNVMSGNDTNPVAYHRAAEIKLEREAGRLVEHRKSGNVQACRVSNGSRVEIVSKFNYFVVVVHSQVFA